MKKLENCLDLIDHWIIVTETVLSNTKRAKSVCENDNLEQVVGDKLFQLIKAREFVIAVQNDPNIDALIKIPNYVAFKQLMQEFMQQELNFLDESMDKIRSEKHIQIVTSMKNVLFNATVEILALSMREVRNMDIVCN
jgi:hypothetical protein